ncbi:MAG: sulfite exporter TauE/SafE family protein [Pseudomonadota bacterium]
MEQELDAEGFLIMATAATLGAAIQAAIGFAFGLIAAPVLLVTMNSSSAIQVLVVIHLVQSAMLVPRLWRHAPRGLLLKLIIGSLFGFPLGLAVFMALDLRALTLTVGFSLLAFAALLALRETGRLKIASISYQELPTWSTFVTGVATGFLTAVLVMPGPPIMVLNAWTAMEKELSRALSLTFFAFCYVMVTALHATMGGMPLSAWITAAALAPFVVVGTLVGSKLSSRLSEGRFRLAVLGVVVFSGIYAIAASY